MDIPSGLGAGFEVKVEKLAASPRCRTVMGRTSAVRITLKGAKKLLGMSDENFGEMMAELRAIKKP